MSVSNLSDEAFGGPRRLPWSRATGLGAVVDGWRADTALGRAFALDEVVPGRQARFSPLPEALHPGLRAALEQRGLRQLYSHQAASFALASSGSDVVVATPTASGKSLCYHLPVLNRLAQAPEARALYLFPTKALSRDQEESLRGLMTEAGLASGAVTYDGDTPGDVRRLARERSGIVITNPDMLHAGILPHHASWARLFAGLSYVVIDELHAYRGIFGSHLANVLRRLERVARFHGATPRFIFASATIGNPGQHASAMLGRPVQLVDECGAPSGSRRVMVYQPPVVDPVLGIRQSYVKATARLAADLVRAGVSTLVFGQSRNTVEVLLKYLRDRLEADRLDASTLLAYRGGYLPGTRRDIEARLRAGDIRCVVATNALELGIDIGSLDAVVCAGYPGSAAALWQRFGRAGRRQGESLALLVTSSAPVDQYIASTAHQLVGAPVEEARIDPDNVEILVQHVKCAAFELPFEQGEAFGNVPVATTTETLDFLASHRVVHPSPGPSGKAVYHWASDAYPANHVSLRSAGWDNVVIVDLDSQKTFAEMDWRSSHTMLHEQAIYQHGGEQFQVERFDYENHKAYVRKVEPDYFTDAMTHVKLDVLDTLASSNPPAAAVGSETSNGGAVAFGMGEVSVVEKVVGYKKIKFHTHENVGYGDVNLPEMQKHTTAFWLTVPEAVVQAMPWPRADVVDALRGLGHAMHTVACVGLMIDPRDLGRTLGSRHDEEGPPRKETSGGPGFDPTVFLYDQIPGGVGLAARLYELREELLRRTRLVLERCECPEGCPACIGPPGTAAASQGAKTRAGALLSHLGVPSLQ